MLKYLHFLHQSQMVIIWRHLIGQKIKRQIVRHNSIPITRRTQLVFVTKLRAETKRTGAPTRVTLFLLSGFHLSVAKPKPKQLHWPITTNVNNAMTQWELGASTRNRRQARENACDQVAIGIGLTSDWLRRWREFFKPITKRSKAKPKQLLLYDELTLNMMRCSMLSSIFFLSL